MSTQVQPIISHAPTRPLDILPEAQQASRRGVGIVSIYPATLIHMLRHNGTTIYTLPEPQRGSYSLLMVYDTQQWTRSIDPDSGTETLIPRPIPAAVVADNLVSQWAGNTIAKPSGLRPGIAIIAGLIPTPNELALLHEQQNDLFNWYINNANDLHVSGHSREIVATHRMAAKYLLDKGAERLPWYPKIDFAAVKDCIACGKQIYATALRCDFCTQNLIDWYLNYDLDTSADPAVAAFIAKIGSNRKTPAPKTAPVQPPLDPKAPRLAQPS